MIPPYYHSVAQPLSLQPRCLLANSKIQGLALRTPVRKLSTLRRRLVPRPRCSSDDCRAERMAEAWTNRVRAMMNPLVTAVGTVAAVTTGRAQFDRAPLAACSAARGGRGRWDRSRRGRRAYRTTSWSMGRRMGVRDDAVGLAAVFVGGEMRVGK